MAQAKTTRKRKGGPRYDDVEFEFFSPDVTLTNYGTVVVRDAEMVLEVTDDDDNLITVVGRLNEHLYRGMELDGPPRGAVRARWTSMGDLFVGVWIQDGEEYVFRFRLSNPEE